MSSVVRGVPTPTAELRSPLAHHPLSRPVAVELSAPSGMTTDEKLDWLSQHDLDGELVPSMGARLELLEAAFIVAQDEMGTPLSDEADEIFHARIDQLYLASLAARVPVRRRSFATRMHAVLIEQRIASRER